MLDLLKAGDFGIACHITESNFSDNIFRFGKPYLGSETDILSKMNALSCDLDERSFELAYTKPLMPIGFKVTQNTVSVAKKINLLEKAHGVKNTQITSPSVKKIGIVSSENNVPNAQSKNLETIQSLIAEAQNIALKAQDLPSLLLAVNNFKTDLESQKFSLQTLIYNDSENIDILWINDSVSHDDNKNNQIMSDNAGKMIVTLFDSLGYGRNNPKHKKQIGFTALSFWPLENNYTNNNNPFEYQICLPLIRRLIYFLKPKKIILAGDMPLKYFCNVDNVLENHGKKYTLKIDDVSFSMYATLNLRHILCSDVIKKYFWFDLLKILHDNAQ